LVRVQQGEPNKKDIRKDVLFIWLFIPIYLVGLERRLLASVLWTLATAVAFPQKSESISAKRNLIKILTRGAKKNTTHLGGLFLTFIGPAYFRKGNRQGAFGANII